MNFVTATARVACRMSVIQELGSVSVSRGSRGSAVIAVSNRSISCKVTSVNVSLVKVFEDSKCCNNHFISACDNCTVILIDDLNELTRQFDRNTAHIDKDGIPAPWIELEKFENEAEELGYGVGQLLDVKDRLVNFDVSLLDNVSVASFPRP